jgi:hypothetical protein
MSLNKDKCGVMFLAGQSILSSHERQLKVLAGVPIVATYKYLGV